MFYLWLKQGGGCDYTIACGEKLIPLNSETTEDLRREVKEQLEYFGFNGDEWRAGLEEAKLLSDAGAEVNFDIGTVHDQLVDETNQAKEERQRQKKREELERLKKELGED